MSNLMLHAGGYKATLHDIQMVSTPTPTRTHTPIPHDWFLNNILESLQANYGYSVTKQQYGLLGPRGEDFFAVLHMDRTSPNGDYNHVLGLRNSHRQKFSAQAVLGTSVFICDNLAFRGNDAVMQLARKHTTNIFNDFRSKVDDKLRLLPTYFADTDNQIANWKSSSLGTDPDTIRRNAADICMTALTRGATNGHLLPRVWHEFNRPDGAGGHSCFKEPNRWSLFNAFTEVEKLSDSPLQSQLRTARLSTILDGKFTVTPSEPEDPQQLIFNY
jgi:hypothetical protein